MVNIDKITYYNSYYRKVFFSANKEVVVTGVAMTVIQKDFGKEKDMYLDTFCGKLDF
ncbi:hypothetical protein D3C78_1442740 [compost metagenome]